MSSLQAIARTLQSNEIQPSKWYFIATAHPASNVTQVDDLYNEFNNKQLRQMDLSDILLCFKHEHSVILGKIFWSNYSDTHGVLFVGYIDLTKPRNREIFRNHITNGQCIEFSLSHHFIAIKDEQTQQLHTYKILMEVSFVEKGHRRGCKLLFGITDVELEKKEQVQYKFQQAMKKASQEQIQSALRFLEHRLLNNMSQPQPQPVPQPQQQQQQQSPAGPPPNVSYPPPLPSQPQPQQPPPPQQPIPGSMPPSSQPQQPASAPPQNPVPPPNPSTNGQTPPDSSSLASLANPEALKNMPQGDLIQILMTAVQSVDHLKTENGQLKQLQKQTEEGYNQQLKNLVANVAANLAKAQGQAPQQQQQQADQWNSLLNTVYQTNNIQAKEGLTKVFHEIAANAASLTSQIEDNKRQWQQTKSNNGDLKRRLEEHLSNDANQFTKRFESDRSFQMDTNHYPSQQSSQQWQQPQPWQQPQQQQAWQQPQPQQQQPWQQPQQQQQQPWQQPSQQQQWQQPSQQQQQQWQQQQSPRPNYGDRIPQKGDPLYEPASRDTQAFLQLLQSGSDLSGVEKIRMALLNQK